MLAIKHAETVEPPRPTARFVLGGYSDKDRYHIVHDARTVRPESICLLVALGIIFGLELFTADWKQDYIQSKSAVKRDILIRPAELEFNTNELVKIVRPIYGLPDSGEYYADTLAHHLRGHCRFQQATTDQSLWLKYTTHNSWS